MKTARAAAVLTWIYAAAFGLPAIPISAYLVAQGTCPRLWACSRRTAVRGRTRRTPNLLALLAAFLGVTILAAWSAWWLWRGRRSGAVVNLALLPIEAIFWLGFAVPIPWLFGIARAVLLAASWASLGDRSSDRSPGQTRSPQSSRELT